MSIVFFRKLKLKTEFAIKGFIRRPFASKFNPFEIKENSPVIIHCCYHKVGTVWFRRVLNAIAAETGLSFDVGTNFGKISNFEQHQHVDVFLDYGSHVKLAKLSTYIGSHMIRDPRDMVVSGYFYHLWTKEIWANIPLAEYRGMSYKEYLNSLDQNSGIMAEIKRISFWTLHMANWNFENPHFFEIRYEEMILDEQSIFRRMFEHYGFENHIIDQCCKIAEKFSFKKMSNNKKKGKSHLRSGRIGEWKEYFNEEHKKRFKELYPGALVRLGYEKDDNW